MASNRAQELVTYTCALCDSDDKVRWYCNDCQQNLCDRCKKAHAVGTKTRKDDVVSIWKANQLCEKPVPEVCKLHPGKLCDLYCLDCDVLFCYICLSEIHNHHSWKPLENKISAKIQHFKEHLTELSAKVEHFRNMTSDRHHVPEAFTNNIDTMRDEVNSHRVKIKAEVDYIADVILAELSSLEKEDSAMHKKDCQNSEEKVEGRTHMLQQPEMTDTSSISLCETDTLLRITLPVYDVTTKKTSPKILTFTAGSIDRVKLTKTFEELLHKSQYQKKDIGSKQVQRLSKFTVAQQNQILSICPVDDCHSWLSIHQYKGLVLVNMEGVVTETVKLDFCPYMITKINKTDILMTSYPLSTFVYKLQLQNKQVTTFADIRPHKASDISINERGEVFVSTRTPNIAILNQSGTFVRKVTIGTENIGNVVCVSPGRLCVVQAIENSWSNPKILTIDEFGSVIQTWTGERDNAEKVGRMKLCTMSCDKYGRLFVPDFRNNQVNVLPRDDTHASCLIDQNHRVVEPTAVGVDVCGNVWIGSVDGTIHVMEL